MIARPQHSEQGPDEKKGLLGSSPLRFVKKSLAFTFTPPERTEPPPFPKLKLCILFLLALCLRWAFYNANGALLLPDSWGRYLPIGQDLFGRWSGTQFDTPGYPAFLGSVESLFGLEPGLFLAQGLLDACSVVMIAGTARYFGLRKGAFLLGLFFALYPGQILMANAALSEPLYTFFLVASIRLLATVRSHSSWRKFLGLGLLVSPIPLIRANGVLAVAVLATLVLLAGLHQRKYAAVTVFFLAAATPTVGWVSINTTRFHIPAIAQGGGWQWLQNMAYFNLIDPKTLPEEEVPLYRDWTSLSAMRARLSADPDIPKEKLDAVFGDIAGHNARREPVKYLAAIPRALLLPRAFIKDTTRAATQPETWTGFAQTAAAAGYGYMVKPLDPDALINIYFSVARRITVIAGKYTLLILALFPAAVVAWRQKHVLTAAVIALPLSQAIVLTLMLNPIERYYFPFESMMWLGFIFLIRAFQKTKGKFFTHP